MNKLVKWLINKDRLYPHLTASLIKNPNRLYAVPLLGILIKIIALIPVGIVVMFIAIYMVILTWINSLVVLATGKYWRHAYDINLGLMRLATKMNFYLFGLTDKYPGFDFKIDDPHLSLDMPYPQNPSRFFAIPVLGGLVRLMLLIPFYMYDYIIRQASTLGVFLLAWAVVLFKGKYPEGIYELTRDSVRLQVAMGFYMTGLSDKYPSFYISTAHKTIKLILIGIVLLFALWGFLAPQPEYTDDNMDFDYTPSVSQLD